MTWTAIILAAGASRRMGRPKALLPIGTETFLSTLANTFQHAGALRVIAVVGAHAAAIRDAKPPCELLEHPGWAAGQLSSALAGIRAALEGGADAVMIHPVDAPRLQPSTVHELLKALPRTAIASHGGQAGHPIALTAVTARDLLRTHGATLSEALQPFAPAPVEVSDSSVLENFNDPAAWAAEFKPA